MFPSIVTLYHDARLLAVDKPAGMPAVPGRGLDKQDCLITRLQAALPAALVVHRLDWATSGVMVFALDAAAQRELGRQFAEREVEKRYIAVVRGNVADDAGTIDLPMRKDFDHPPRHCIDPLQGRAARTDWRVLHRRGDQTRLLLMPLTGRSHQLRLHLSAVGHPIVGDALYGDARHADAATQTTPPRMLLHAERLSVLHPDDGRRLTFESPCPF